MRFVYVYVILCSSSPLKKKRQCPQKPKHLDSGIPCTASFWIKYHALYQLQPTSWGGTISVTASVTSMDLGSIGRGKMGHSFSPTETDGLHPQNWGQKKHKRQQKTKNFKAKKLGNKVRCVRWFLRLLVYPICTSCTWIISRLAKHLLTSKGYPSKGIFQRLPLHSLIRHFAPGG